MSIDYGKTAPEARYFLLFGQEGAWQEVLKDSYVAAQVANGVKGITPVEFQVGTMRGTVTTDGSRPKDATKKIVAQPMIRRTSEALDASYRLIFPSGSFNVASMDEDADSVTVVLTPAQYEAFCKVQGPVLLDRWAASVEKSAKEAGPLKSIFMEGVSETLRSVASEMRDDKPARVKSPRLQDLKDIFKS